MDERLFYDIAFSFLIGGDGCVYEGRGWDIEGAIAKGYNKRNIGISFIGSFNRGKPPKRQLVAAERLIQYGLDLKMLTEHYRLFAHRQVSNTESPGDELYEIVTKWPHWSENVSVINSD